MPRPRVLQLHPSVLLVASFAGAALAGALVLRLPAAVEGPPLRFVDALFSATSAVCVTGLVVVDTGTRFSIFGQAVILVLIQGGGLGIMTFAVFVYLVLGRPTFQARMVIQGSLHHSPSGDLWRLVRYIVGFTLAFEGAGAILLYLRFRQDFAEARAAWLAVFHSVSAFCNAGFSLFPDSLVRYRGDAAVILVVSLLFTIGGLGFLVNLEVRDHLRARLARRLPPALTLHTRMVLWVSAGLLLAGMAAFLALERENLLGGMEPGERLLAAWFQSATARTAGFNTVDFARATSATLFFTILLMFIGASPGSTGGGVKTTSFGLLLALVWSRWLGRDRPTAFHRTIPHEVMSRALSVMLLSWAIASAALLILVMTEQGGRPHESAEPRFLALMFESVSAFGTVGLSTGVTPALSAAGKVVVVFLMLLGRVGPLTLAVALVHRRGRAHFRYADENVMVG